MLLQQIAKQIEHSKIPALHLTPVRQSQLFTASQPGGVTLRQRQATDGQNKNQMSGAAESELVSKSRSAVLDLEQSC